ncbi:MAG: 4Fe-4S binding protein [Promethearchaeota archaeon]
MNEKTEKKEEKKDFKALFMILGIFYTLAIVLWLVLGILFYLINFIIIGTAVGLGVGLYPILSKKNKHKARKLSQALMGGYMFIGLGFGLIYILFGYFQPENMQIEGFWFWFLAGSFGAAILHYFIAKIFGPLAFNRGWCGWACWTAAVLDYLPWKKSPGRIKKLGILRYIHFAIVAFLIFYLVLVINYTLQTILGVVDLSGDIPQRKRELKQYDNIWQIPEFWWFLIGNAFYYLIGIFLAATLKDNRAFCKYVCPIACFLKIGSQFSLLKITGNSDECTSCKACDRACPMDISVSEYIKNNMRVTSSECILCFECVNACPNDLLKTSNKFDKKYKKFIQYKE